MSPVLIKSPNSDAIWAKWKHKNVQSQKLEKHYGIKGAVFKIDDITAAEFVQAVKKGSLLYYEKTMEIKPSAVKPRTERTTLKKIEKVKFYSFSGTLVKDEWKGDTTVPMYDSLVKENCPKCKGAGGTPCKKCGGTKLLTCPDCSNKPKSCNNCNGTGKLKAEITVLNEKQQKSKKILEVNCHQCYGNGKELCMRCGGSGKVTCKYCVGTGLSSCGECDGTGSIFRYDIKPVPFKYEQYSEPVILSSMKLTGLEKEMGREIQKAIEQVEGIPIKNPDKELTQSYLEPNLGYYDKETNNVVKQAEREWKEAEKNDDLKIHLPLYLFPLIILECTTRKGSKFQVYSIGSEQKFLTFGSI